jgi:hypothetical protein
MNGHPFDMKKPCANCPFLKADAAVHILPQRVRDIASTEGSFPCHKTTVEAETEEGTDLVIGPRTKQCIGLVILLLKIDKPNQMVQVAERLGWLDTDAIMADKAVVDSVHDSVDEMVKAHAKFLGVTEEE